jgi:hypothetical protein
VQGVDGVDLGVAIDVGGGDASGRRRQGDADAQRMQGVDGVRHTAAVDVPLEHSPGTRSRSPPIGLGGSAGDEEDGEE